MSNLAYSAQLIFQVCYASGQMCSFVLDSLLSSDIEDDGARDHLVCNDEEWRWRTIQDVCDVILDDAHTVPTPDLQKQKNVSFCIIVRDELNMAQLKFFKNSLEE